MVICYSLNTCALNRTLFWFWGYFSGSLKINKIQLRHLKILEPVFTAKRDVFLFHLARLLR